MENSFQLLEKLCPIFLSSTLPSLPHFAFFNEKPTSHAYFCYLCYKGLIKTFKIKVLNSLINAFWGYQTCSNLLPLSLYVQTPEPKWALVSILEIVFYYQSFHN